MSKKIYKLSDIEKILTYAPPIFFIFLATLCLFVAYFIINYQQVSKIALMTQKEKFFNQKHLDNFIDESRQKTKTKLSKRQQELQKSVHLLKGVYATTRYKGLTSHIKKIEDKNHIFFVVFDKDLNIYHGEEIVKNIQKLIFGQKVYKKYLNLTLLYIFSQGANSSLSWIDETNRTIQLSYFNKTYDAELFIGAFSLVDSIKRLMIDEYTHAITTISNSTNKERYFWIYDNETRRMFNANNEKRWEIAIKTNTESLYENLTKYQLHIGITPNLEILKKHIKKVEDEFSTRKIVTLSIISLIFIFLLIFTTLFSNFIKKRFNTYNNQLEAIVKNEIAKNEEKQKLLIQQNRLVAMGKMIGAIAHQWRQPLNNISLIIHFIKDNIQEDRFNSFFNRAKEQIEYMSQTIDDFRDFHKPSKCSEPFEIKKAISSAITILHVDDNITINLIGAHLFIDGYKNEFQQAILNILSNAKDAIGEDNGTIDIAISDKKITIHNDGGRASKEVLDRMFEPYFTTKEDKKGLGIGLYMTKVIIEESMGGEIFANNSLNGITFTIIL